MLTSCAPVDSVNLCRVQILPNHRLVLRSVLLVVSRCVRLTPVVPGETVLFGLRLVSHNNHNLNFIFSLFKFNYQSAFYLVY